MTDNLKAPLVTDAEMVTAAIGEHAVAMTRVAEALELLATAYVQVNHLDREETVIIWKALKLRGWFEHSPSEDLT